MMKRIISPITSVPSLFAFQDEFYRLKGVVGRITTPFIKQILSRVLMLALRHDKTPSTALDFSKMTFGNLNESHFYNIVYKVGDSPIRHHPLRPLGPILLSLPQKDAKSLELSKLTPAGRSNSTEFNSARATLETNCPQSCLSPERSRRVSFLRTRFFTHCLFVFNGIRECFAFVYFFTVPSLKLQRCKVNGKSKSPLAARAVIIALTMFFVRTAMAQDIELSQYTLVSPIQNPAFTGAHSGVRLNLIHRNQWTQVPGQFSASFASIDIGSAKKKSGLGINVNSYNEGQVYLQTQEASALYGYHSKARIKKQELSFHLGAGLGYIRRSIDWSQAVFSDQLDPVLGNTNPTEANIDELNNYGSIYSSFGALLETPFTLPIAYSKKDADGMMRFGYAAQRLLPFRRSFTNTPKIQATTKHSFSAMLMLPLHSYFLSKRDLQYIRPAFRYAFQGPIKTWDFSLTWVKRPVLLGASFRMNKLHPVRVGQDFHQIILFGSYEIKNIGERKRWSAQIGYAYDIPLNKLSLNAGSTHELFLTFYRNTKKRNRRTSMNACEEYMSGGGVPL